MSTASSTPTMTMEEMLALPENGVDRELIRGQLREKFMTMRHRRPSRVEINIGTELENWRRIRESIRNSASQAFSVREALDFIRGPLWQWPGPEFFRPHDVPTWTR